MFSPIFSLLKRGIEALGINPQKRVMTKRDGIRLAAFMRRGRITSHRFGRTGRRAKAVARRRRLNVIAAESRWINRA